MGERMVTMRAANNVARFMLAIGFVCGFGAGWGIQLLVTR